MDKKTNQPRFLEELLTFVWKEYPISSTASSVPSVIIGLLIPMNGLYLVPGIIMSYSIASLNLVVPKEYNIILPLFKECHTESPESLITGIIEDGSCIVPSLVALPVLTIFSIIMIPSVAVEHSTHKIIESTNNIINYIDSKIIDLYSGIVDETYSGLEAY